MTRKKSALGCRVLSIVLSLLMILCAVPLVSFAANGEDAGPVLEKSREDVFLFRALRPFSGEPYTVGSKLGDCAINKTGVALQVPKPGTIQYINYLTTKLTWALHVSALSTGGNVSRVCIGSFRPVVAQWE